MYCPKELEKELHQQFSNKRIRGEWFELNDKDINTIIEKMKEYQ